MSKIADYRIEERSSAYALQECIKQLMLDGWQPLGSVSVVKERMVGWNSPAMRYSQALVKRSNNQDEADFAEGAA